MHLLFPLRLKWRSMAVAMLAAVMLVVLTAGSVLAQGHVANDGQTLEMQSPEVQQLYMSVWGDNAAMQWAADHNAAIGQVAPQAKHPRYDEVFHVAYTRSMDMELAGRITADVIARGTIDAFLAGMDMGVVYGYVPPPPPAPRSGGGGGGGGGGSSSGSGTTSTSTTTGTGLFEGVSFADIDVIRGAAASGIPGLPDVSVTYASPYAAVEYDLSDLPAGMALSGRQIEGTPRDLGSHSMTWTATQTDPGADTDAMATDDDRVVSSSLMFTIHVLAEARPVVPDSVPMFADDMLEYTFFAGEYVQIFLPAASGGVGDLTYTQSGLPAGGLDFNVGRREIHGTISDSSTATITVTDMNDTPAMDTLTVTITMTEDEMPTLANVSGMTTTVGQEFASAPLPASPAGNEPLTYSISGLPEGLSMNSDRQIVGRPSASNLGDEETTKDFTVTYKVVDSDPYGESDMAMVTFDITVNESS